MQTRQIEQADTASHLNLKRAVGPQAKQGSTVRQAADLSRMQGISANDMEHAVKQTANQMRSVDHAGNVARAVEYAKAATKPVVAGWTDHNIQKHSIGMDHSHNNENGDTAQMEAAANNAKSAQYENIMKQAHGMAQTADKASMGGTEDAVVKKRSCSMHKVGSLDYADCMKGINSDQSVDSANQIDSMNQEKAKQHAESAYQSGSVKHGQTWANNDAKIDADQMQQADSMANSQAIVRANSMYNKVQEQAKGAQFGANLDHVANEQSNDAQAMEQGIVGATQQGQSIDSALAN